MVTKVASDKVSSKRRKKKQCGTTLKLSKIAVRPLKNAICYLKDKKMQKFAERPGNVCWKWGTSEETVSWTTKGGWILPDNTFMGKFCGENIWKKLKKIALKA